jgi:hypothetical protein
MTIWADRRRHAAVADRTVGRTPAYRDRVVEREPY